MAGAVTCCRERPNNTMDSDHADATDDLIVAEVRAVRDAHAARFGYDVKAIFDDIRASQKASGHKYVRYPPRRIAVDAEDPTQSARRSDR